jgi:hypothetical protein
MAGERTIEGWRLTLKSTGAGRYASAAFLAFWLCGWAVGEAFALWMLIRGAIALLTGAPPEAGHAPLPVGPAVIAGLFLLAWLTLWTVGGLAAIGELLRLLWGEDRIEFASGRLTVTWFRGPFRSTRHFERDQIRRVTLVGRDLLALETVRGRFDLSGLGTRAERVEGARALRAEMGLQELPAAAAAIPPGWEEIITPEGERALVAELARRRIQARVAGGAALALAAVTFAVARESLQRVDLAIAALILLAFTGGLAASALWLARGRWEWRIGSGRLTLRRRYGAALRDVFEARRLVIEMSSDSDGDAWYQLDAYDAAGPPTPAPIRWRTSTSKHRRTVARRMNDASAVRDLGAWLARASGLPLEDLTSPEQRAVQLAELRAMLENSGRFGRWAVKIVDRLEGERKKAG